MMVYELSINLVFWQPNQPNQIKFQFELIQFLLHIKDSVFWILDLKHIGLSKSWTNPSKLTNWTPLCSSSSNVGQESDSKHGHNGQLHGDQAYWYKGWFPSITLPS